MPYIASKSREHYDPIIESIKLKCRMSLYEELKEERDQLIEILKAVEGTNPSATDGNFNYFITKLLIAFGWVDKDMGYLGTIGGPIGKVFKEFIFAVMLEVYYPPKYFRFNRAVGMLICCRNEFRKVYGIESQCVEMLLDEIAEKYYDEVVYPYEQKKRNENGPVTK